MNVTFVDNLLLEQNGGRYDTVLQPHLGLISLVAVARTGGHTARLYDPKIAISRDAVPLDSSLYRRIAQDILRDDPDVVGMTSLGCNFICTVKIAQILKQHRPHLPILLGGPHATVLDREILHEFGEFDVVARHEAETTLLPLLAAAERGDFADVPGVTYRRAGDIVVAPGSPVIDDLDALPTPAYDAYPIEELQLSWLRVEAGRGCPFMCTFCSTASFFGRQYRLRSAERLVAELDLLHERYGVSHFSLQHDLFTVNRQKVVQFCEVVASRGYTWKCSARMDCVDPELLDVMRRAGCIEIYFGIETGSERMQKVAKKRLDLTLFHPTLDAVDEVGMAATVSFITGYPQESIADQHDTLNLIGSCFSRPKPPHNVQLHMMTPEPGTDLLGEFQSSLAFDGYISDFNFPLFDASDVELIRTRPNVFMNHHYFLAALPRARHVFVTAFYYVLYQLGPLVLEQLLQRFDGRLSRLVDLAEDRWRVSVQHDAEATRAMPDQAFLIDVVLAEFGDADPLVSLVRYMCAVSRLAAKSQGRPAAPVAGTQGTFSVTAKVRLNGRAVLLRAIHDCPAILTDLEAARTLNTSTSLAPRFAGARGRNWHRKLPPSNPVVPTEPLPSVAARSTYVVYQEHPGTKWLRNFEVGEPVADMLDAARSPARISDLVSTIADTSADRADAIAVCRSFLEIGVLERVRRRVPRPSAMPFARAKEGEWGLRDTC